MNILEGIWQLYGSGEDATWMFWGWCLLLVGGPGDRQTNKRLVEAAVRRAPDAMGRDSTPSSPGRPVQSDINPRASFPNNANTPQKSIRGQWSAIVKIAQSPGARHCSSQFSAIADL